MTRLEAKKFFIRELAEFLSSDLAAKSICCEAELSRPKNDPRPKFAQQWARLRNASTVSGWSDVDETEKQLLEFLL